MANRMRREHYSMNLIRRDLLEGMTLSVVKHVGLHVAVIWTLTLTL
jgi:hypothetical protein